MKFILQFVFITCCSTVFSQLKEAYFQYNIEVEAIDTSLQTKQTVAMLRDSRMELYFAPNKTRVDFKMGNLSVTSVIVDRDKNIALSISDGYSGKIAKLEPATMNTPQKDSTAILQFFDDKKVILGYNCKKVIVTEKEIVTEYWYTDEIDIDAANSGVINPNIPGFPVSFSKIDGGIRMTFQLSNMKEYLEHSLDAIFFTIPPKGFKLIN